MMLRANSRIETMSEQDARSFVDAAIVRAVRLAAAESPFHRWFYAEHGVDVESVTDAVTFTTSVPVVRKLDYLRFQERFPDAWRADARQIHSTSGTSGVGKELHRRTSHDLASLGTGGAYQYFWAGLRPGEPILFTIPYSQTMAGPYFQATATAAGMVPINGFTGSTVERIEMLTRFGCTGMSITPSYLHRMTAEAKRIGFDPRHDGCALRAILLSGEPYGVEWAIEMQQFWNATVHEGWGATQTLGVVMATRSGAVSGHGRGVLHGIGHRCFIEVLGDDGAPVPPGERGEIVVTTLRTRGTPSIRFGMGDSIKLLRDGFFPEFEAGSIGRTDDMIKVKGMNIWPSAVDAVVLRDPVLDYRATVHTTEQGSETVDLELEVSGDRHPALCDRIADAVKRDIGISMTVSVLPPGTLGEQHFKSRRWTDRRAVR
ncbi:AMP-binding protein [Rhodococcus sp. B10]|uniref:phenylacetate--CoA ligase family protein n=1 Tax=Rhodococcus sp. B10 TaxID=2695876 RepID=UPI0016AA3FAC|nr:AMP-binding protein [Rhodococcus sp. B10]NIL76081.1 Phenylacetate-coenzyme A ligase [Rhodococcus sp. B10]